MNKQTQLLLILGVAGVAAYFIFVKKPAEQRIAALPPPGSTTTTDAQVRIAEAQASAARAQSQADAAKAQADAAASIAQSQQTQWYMPLMQGIGEGAGTFLGGLGGFLK